ncbi:Sec-independent protein translocase protein TatC [subsurface metagenome]
MDEEKKIKKSRIKRLFSRRSKKAKDTQKEMPFIDHLEELRKRIIVVLAVFVVLFGAAYPFHNTLLGLLTKPLINKNLVFLDITEPFLVNIKISFMAAVMVIMPLLVLQIISFAFPAFSKKIRKRIIPIAILFFILFYGGIAFCYFFMIPIAVNWLISQGAELIQTLSVTKYVTFIGWFLLGAGLIFELPLVLVFLIKINVLTVKQLRRQWRIVYIVILLLCAIITPDWSPVTMGVLAAPMILLYELALLLARFL